MLCISKARSWLVRLTERNHFRTALWRQKSRVSCFIYIVEKRKCLLYAKWSLSTEIITFPRRQFGKMLSWTDRFKQPGLTASNDFTKRGIILHSDLYVAKLSQMGRSAFRQMQNNVFYLINLVIVYIGIFRSWSWRHARALHIMIR